MVPTVVTLCSFVSLYLCGFFSNLRVEFVTCERKSSRYRIVSRFQDSDFHILVYSTKSLNAFQRLAKLLLSQFLQIERIVLRSGLAYALQDSGAHFLR